jgi:hypothetical protein
VEHRGLPLSRYDAEYAPGSKAGEIVAVARPRVFETPFASPQPRLFDLDAGWLKALKVDGYVLKKTRGPRALQGVLFPYWEAI